MATPNKLSPHQIRAIRFRYQNGEGPAALAQEYGVTRMTVYNHCKGLSRARRELVQLSVTIGREEATALRDYAERRGISISEAMRLAVNGLLALRRG